MNMKMHVIMSWNSFPPNRPVVYIVKRDPPTGHQNYRTTLVLIIVKKPWGRNQSLVLEELYWRTILKVVFPLRFLGTSVDCDHRKLLLLLYLRTTLGFIFNATNFVWKIKCEENTQEKGEKSTGCAYCEEDIYNCLFLRENQVAIFCEIDVSGVYP